MSYNGRYREIILKNDTETLMRNLQKEPSDISEMSNYYYREVIEAEAVDIYKLLVYDFDVKFSTDNLIIHACVMNKANMLRFMIDQQANIHCRCTESYDAESYQFYGEKSDYPMYAACCNNSYECVKILLEHDVDPNTRDGDCLVTACDHGFLNIVKLLLDHGADAACKNNKPIVIAVQYQRIQIFKLLKEYGAKFDENTANKYAEKYMHQEPKFNINQFIDLLLENDINLASVLRLLMTQ